VEESGHSWRMLKPARMDPSRHFATVNCRIAKVHETQQIF
jgi:hypothetical protein